MPCLIMCVDVWVYMHGYRQAPGHQLSSLLASPPGKPLFSILPSQRAPNISNISKTFYISLLNCKHIVPAIYVLHIKTKSFFFLFFVFVFLRYESQAEDPWCGSQISGACLVCHVQHTNSTLQTELIKPQLPLSCSLF